MLAVVALVIPVVNIVVTYSVSILCICTVELCYALSVGIFSTVLAKAKFFYLGVWLLLEKEIMSRALCRTLAYNFYMGTQNGAKLEV